ncbi:hypothetical protein [Myceligenerans pegani]|uniref:Uncharacterized protein n=1 Tax=Myceligenerans pegani TaxID=2776917 RepID=A0ABR9N5P9_9MICO|nr:hypothetical protein [Myceligenerans sp. TRM 65318]MBE1878988.1 hypothetical protein [Myceligenerans sp. TRM 65318]MBE3021259.1 hypothetical protein [Myceligenerans sp. TRM 65318]
MNSPNQHYQQSLEAQRQAAVQRPATSATPAADASSFAVHGDPTLQHPAGRQDGQHGQDGQQGGRGGVGVRWTPLSQLPRTDVVRRMVAWPVRLDAYLLRLVRRPVVAPARWAGQATWNGTRRALGTAAKALPQRTHRPSGPTRRSQRRRGVNL